jgi:hypothetical protein
VYWRISAVDGSVSGGASSSLSSPLDSDDDWFELLVVVLSVGAIVNVEDWQMARWDKMYRSVKLQKKLEELGRRIIKLEGKFVSLCVYIFLATNYASASYSTILFNRIWLLSIRIKINLLPSGED